MYFLYLIMSVAELIVAGRIYRRIVNPVSLYVVPWLLSVSLYELKLIKYLDLSLATWFVIILFQSIFFACCFVFKSNGKEKSWGYCRSLDKTSMFWSIIVLSLFSSYAIIPNFVIFLKFYGISFLSKMNEIYQNRIDGTGPYNTIPYLGSFVYFCVVLTGIYFKKFNFRLPLLLPLALALIDSIQGGGRFGLILTFLLFIIPYICVKNDEKNAVRKRNLKKSLIRIVPLVSVLLVAFLIVTKVRSSWIEENEYMSDTMKALVRFSPSIYKIYEYFSSPVGVLNVYLENPKFSFGTHSLSFFISILNKLGCNLPYNRYQEFYYIPIYTNVGSYIREIVQDYSFFAPFLLFGFTVLFSKAYALLQKNSPFGEILFSIMGVSVFMSFFMCYYRETVFWIMLIEIPIFHYIYRFFRKRAYCGSPSTFAIPPQDSEPDAETSITDRDVDVSIIMVNYFTRQLTVKAIQSIVEKSDRFAYEIIVVDNSCDQKEYSLLSNELEGIAKVLDAKENLGFGKANNLAAKYARGKYLFFLNTDTLLMNNAVYELFAFLEKNDRAGVAGGNLYTATMEPNHSFVKKEKNLESERKQSGLIAAFAHHCIRRCDFNYSDSPLKIDGYVCGACLMIRSTLFRDLHGFDDDIFMYAEEALLCRRVIREAGYEIYNVPSCCIVHLEGKSFNGTNAKKIRMNLDGNFVYYLKAYGYDAAMEYLDLQIKVFQKKARMFFFMKNKTRLYETYLNEVRFKQDCERKEPLSATASAEEDGQ